MTQTVRFYFSFRSPYAWFAAERWHAELGDLQPAVQRIPFFPTRETFPNDPTLVPNKYAYIIQDIFRLARDFQLVIKPPPALDTDWARAHAAYLGVEREQPERAEAFMLEMFRSRFSLGLDVALPDVIASAAARAGAAPSIAQQAALSPELQHESADSFERAQRTDRIFGAPSFVLGDQLFWGHDRMHHLRRAVIDARAAA